MATTLNSEEKSCLSRFLVRRQLKEPAVELLANAVDKHSLNRGTLTTSKNATYPQIVDDIAKGLKNEWINVKAVTSLLNDAELAGRQHVCLYKLPVSEQKKKEVFDQLKSPSHARTAKAGFREFFETPGQSFCRVIHSTDDEVLVKFVAKRFSWNRELLKDEEDEQLIQRTRVVERNAMIARCSLKDDLLELRVPPREASNASDTGRSVYDHFTKTLGRHLPKDWDSHLRVFPLADTFNKIIKNRNDFCLRHDTPESTTARISIAKKGKIEDLEDLRDDPLWTHGSGYSRTSLRGVWQVGPRLVYMHFNCDHLKLSQKTTIRVARLFIPQLCTNQDTIHAIRRIQQHI